MSKYCEDIFGDLLLKQPLETHPVGTFPSYLYFISKTFLRWAVNQAAVSPILHFKNPNKRDLPGEGLKLLLTGLLYSAAA